MKFIKSVLKVSFILAILSILSIFVANLVINHSVKDKIYSSIEEIPNNKVGLLLGTSKKLSDGRINLYYQYRIDAAVELYQTGKVKYVLVSGDNSTQYYDEPTTIKNDLIARGIPEDKIFLDYAGFRTLDSVIRSKEIFGQDSITVISQQFHNERAIYIANRKGIEAIGFNAQDVNIKYGFKTQIREKLARVKMMLDLIFGKQAKFLGESIEIK